MTNIELKNIRESLNYSKTEFADRIGISAVMQGKYEKGTREIPETVVEAVDELVETLTAIAVEEAVAREKREAGLSAAAEAPAAEELSAPAAAEAEPVTEEAAPAAEEAAPVSEEAEPVTEEAAPVSEEAEPAAEEAAPVSEEAEPAAEAGPVIIELETEPVEIEIETVPAAEPTPPSGEDTVSVVQAASSCEVLLPALMTPWLVAAGFLGARLMWHRRRGLPLWWL